MEHEKLACATFKYLGTMVVAHETAVTERSREYAWAQSLSPKLDTDLTRNTRAPHFTPKHWLLCHMGLYKFEFEFTESRFATEISLFLSVLMPLFAQAF